jgi:hypothetical protein
LNLDSDYLPLVGSAAQSLLQKVTLDHDVQVWLRIKIFHDLRSCCDSNWQPDATIAVHRISLNPEVISRGDELR